MSALAPTLQAWFTDRLIAQRNVSPHTIRAYRDTLRLLLDYAEARLGRQPSAGLPDARAALAIVEDIYRSSGYTAGGGRPQA